jgi:hypothetical protein
MKIEKSQDRTGWYILVIIAILAVLYIIYNALCKIPILNNLIPGCVVTPLIPDPCIPNPCGKGTCYAGIGNIGYTCQEPNPSNCTPSNPAYSVTKCNRVDYCGALNSCEWDLGDNQGLWGCTPCDNASRCTCFQI